MKKYIYLIALVGLSFSTYGQTTDKNYIKSTTYQQPYTQSEVTAGGIADDNKLEAVQYFDGLGRPVQAVSARAGGARENIVQYTEYDYSGIQSKGYLPWASGSDAQDMDYMLPGILRDTIYDFYDTPKYQNTPNPYSEVHFEPSPRYRPKEQGAPGYDWRVIDTLDTDHTIKFEYGTNLASDNLYNFSVTFTAGNTENPDLSYHGTYAAGEIFKTVTKDENWKPSSTDNHTTQEFKNKEGQVLLKRSFNNSVAHDTYYIYDDFGNLTFVLSPEASAQIVSGSSLVFGYDQILSDLGYRYKYDDRNRLIEKKIPGKDWEYIIYDQLDRVIMTQDGLQRANGQWLFTKYDKYSRVVFTGIYNNASQDRSSGQQAAKTSTTFNEVRVVAPPTDVSGTLIYYTNDALPTADHLMDVLTINYYDDYVDTAGMNVPATTSYGTATTTNLKGLPTVSKVRVLEPSGPVVGATAWITSITGYDDKGQPVYGETDNPYLETSDVSESLLDFTGKPTETYTSHTKTALPTIETRDYFTYDHMGRLLTHHQKIDDESVQLIAENLYDELGQLIQKSVGGDSYVDGYTDITNADVTAQGNIAKNSSANAWDSGAKTRGEILENGGILFTVVHANFRHYKVGLVDTGGSNNNGWGDFDFAIYIRGDGTVDLVSGNTTIASGITTYVAGDLFSVVRQGTQIYFRKGSTVLGSPIAFNDTSTLTGKAGLYSYNSEVADVQLVGVTDQILQEVDYKYNIRGWLTDINDVDFSGGFKDPDLFSFRINYTAVEGVAINHPIVEQLYNGNIAQTIWKTTNTDEDKRSYSYGYDELNRLIGARNHKGALLDINAENHLGNLTYDKNGNIETLDRRGKAENSNSYPLWDDLSYTYSGNKLQGVVDSAPATDKHLGFNDGNNSSSDFTYDVNGNMTVDNNKGITGIAYNHLNLPTSVVFGSTGQIDYIYDATGIKLRKTVTQTTGGTNTTHYAGGYVYLNNTLQFIAQPEGYVDPVAQSSQVKGSSNGTTTYSAYNYIFQFKDHLGNIRLSYGDSDKNGAVDTSEIIEESHYYPFGLKQKGYNYVQAGGNDLAQQWKFGGKQYQEELGLDWYDITARNYDPALGRWMNLDPLAEAMRRHSPYNYAFDNPIFFIDPDGMMPCDTGNCPEDHAAAEPEGNTLTGAVKGAGELAFSMTGAGALIQQGELFGALITGNPEFQIIPRPKAEEGEFWGFAGAMVAGAIIEPGVIGEAQTAKKILNTGAELLLDTNVVISNGDELAKSGKNVVKDQISNIEINNLVDRGKLKGKPKAADNIQDVPSSNNIHDRINIRGLLTSKKRGNFADGVIGATAKVRDATLVTRDKALIQAVRKNGGKALDVNAVLNQK